MNLDELVRLALEEDLGPGDLTTEATVPPDLLGTARIVAKQALVVSGVRAARRVLSEWACPGRPSPKTATVWRLETCSVRSPGPSPGCSPPSGWP